MKSYHTYPSERITYQDRVTGATVHQLTNHKGHSVHPYFTDDGWYDQNRRMLFQGDRENAHNIFSIELESGEISQLTNLPAGGPDLASPLFVNRKYNEIYYTYKRCVYALNLETLDARPLYIIPQGFTFGGARPTADGEYVVGGLTEDTSARIKANLSAGYIGMREIFEAKPDCRIIRINVTTGEVEQVWQENCWVGHINPSLTRDNLLSFCHEGPWQLVDHRIWVLDLETGKARKIRERRQEGEMVGHEYWFEDGIHIGYQVHHRGENAESFFGFQRYDGEDELEASCGAPMPTPDHIHSLGFDFVVSDSGKTIKGYKYDGKTFDGPRIICMHDGDFFWGAHHPHPAISHDGKSIVFNSNRTGYCNIYMVEVPEDFYSLPKVNLDELRRK